MAATPHQANRRQKPAQASPGIAASQVNSDRVRKPIMRPSCLGEFEWPQVGEFEVAIRAYERLSSGRVDYPLAVAGTIQSINERTSQDDAARPYWVVQLAVPKTAPDEQGVVTKVDAYVTTGRAALIEDLQVGDEVIIFGEWQTRPPNVSPNTKPKTPNSPVKAWKNLPLKFALTHAKQIVRTNPR